MLMALALLQADDIEAGLDAVIAYAKENKVFNHLQQYFAYIKRQWIRKEGVDAFSVYNHRHRTNNSIESFHAALARYLKVAHPNIFVFLGKIYLRTYKN